MFVDLPIVTVLGVLFVVGVENNWPKVRKKTKVSLKMALFTLTRARF